MKHTPAEIAQFEREISQMTPEQLSSATVYENILPKHKYVHEAETLPDSLKNELEAKYRAAETELLTFGIETKIKTFQEFEDATFKLNKLYQDELNY